MPRELLALPIVDAQAGTTFYLPGPIWFWGVLVTADAAVEALVLAYHGPGTDSPRIAVYRHPAAQSRDYLLPVPLRLDRGLLLSFTNLTPQCTVYYDIFRPEGGA
jgi:hypothetical protein